MNEWKWYWNAGVWIEKNIDQKQTKVNNCNEILWIQPHQNRKLLREFESKIEYTTHYNMDGNTGMSIEINQ